MSIAGASGRMAGCGSARRVFRIRRYRVYTAGDAVSPIGGWMQRFSVGRLARELSHSPTRLGIVAVADPMPTQALEREARGAVE